MAIENIYLLIPVAGFMLFRSRRSQFFLFVLSILSLLFLKWVYYFFEPIYEVQNPVLLEVLASVSAIFIGFFLMNMFHQDTKKAIGRTHETLKELQQANEKLIAKEKALIQKNLELEMQIRLKNEAVLAKGESDMRYQLLVENAFDGIMILSIDPPGIVGCNQKMLDFFETDLEYLKTRGIGDFIIPEQPAGRVPLDYKERLAGEILKKGKMSLEVLFKSKSGKKKVAQIAAVLSPDKKTAVAIFKNISGQWDAKEKIIQANRELTNFAHAASHDLREPLRMIHSFAQLLNRRNAQNFDEASREYIHFILDASSRMTTLIQDLLEYATAGTNLREIKLVNLNDIVFTINNILR
ncbi:MAG: hypothetical protein D6714_19170, partial [Bacteroidetes bacterium]